MQYPLSVLLSLSFPALVLRCLCQRDWSLALICGEAGGQPAFLIVRKLFHVYLEAFYQAENRGR